LDEPWLSDRAPRALRVKLLRDWLAAQTHVVGNEKRIALKHPLLCVMGDEILEAWGQSTVFIQVCRSYSESLRSLHKTGWWTAAARRNLMFALLKARNRFFKRRPHLQISYDRLRRQPEMEIGMIVKRLKLHPTRSQLRAAIDFVKTDQGSPLAD
jgi:hypothetical protein